MTRKLQILRGTTAQNNAYTGAVGELTMDTDRNEVRIHDGQTVGGIKIGNRNMPILTSMFFDHLLNDISWLRADTFSWQSGDVYKAAYEHLAEEFASVTEWSYETVGGVYIGYKLMPDGHKITDISSEQYVQAIYEATGVAWYYILDTENKQFKLPRTKYGFTGLRDSVGGYVEPALPNITGNAWARGPEANSSGSDGALYVTATADTYGRGHSEGSATAQFNLDASRSSTIYKDGATVQPPATQMYLYFYVGNFEQSAIEQTAGITTETLNGKADTDLGNIPANYDYVVESQLPTADNGYTWYRKYKSGWVEQGGRTRVGEITNETKSITLPIEMSDNQYWCILSWVGREGSTGAYSGITKSDSSTPTTLVVQIYLSGVHTMYWQVSGMSAQ